MNCSLESNILGSPANVKVPILIAHYRYCQSTVVKLKWMTFERALWDKK